jgi:hypothetical protein
MNCQETRELLSEYLDQRLASGQSTAVEEHAASCRDCHEELEALRRTVSLLGRLDETEPSPGFVSEVERKIERGQWLSRLRVWFLEPVVIKVPLEVTAITILSIIAFQIVKSPQIEPDGKPAAGFRDLAKREEPERVDPAKDKSQPQPSYRAAKPASPAAPKEQPAAIAPLAEKKESASALREAAPEVPMSDIVTDDVPAYHARVKALVAELGGKVLREEGSADEGLLLTVEVPQSFQQAFWNRLSGRAEPRARRDVAGEKVVGAIQQEQKRASDELSGRRSEPEPKATLQLRILPKR